MEIRKATPSDALAIANMEKEIFPDPWSEKDILSQITLEAPAVLVAEKGGAVCGYVICRLIVPEGEIYRIAVSPEARGRSIGYRLLDALVRDKSSEGLESLFLEVRENNVYAIRLYESFGFSRIGVRRGYYKNPTEDAILMMYTV